MGKTDSNLKRSAPLTKTSTPPEKVLGIFKSPPTINVTDVQILTPPTRSVIKPNAQVIRMKVINKENMSSALVQPMLLNRPQVKVLKKISPPSTSVKLQVPVRAIPQDNGEEIVQKTY